MQHIAIFESVDSTFIHDYDCSKAQKMLVKL